MTQGFYIISQDGCRACDEAKRLLDDRDLPYIEHKLETAEQKSDFKAQGFTTVPQIWLDGEHIGGRDQLKAFLA